MTWPRTHVQFPTDCVIAVTYLCNSRCVMCDFWKETRKPTMTLDDYRKIPRTLRDINVSGGEPFLHPQIVDIVRVIRETCPRARITISTNGFLTDVVIARVREILRFFPTLGIRISLDGVGEMHERIRRIPHGFEKVVATLRGCKAIGVRDLGLAYTMSGENVEHLTKVYDLSMAEGVQFTCAVAQSSDFYFGGKRVDRAADPTAVAREFDALVDRELRRWNPKAWVRAYFADGLKRLALAGEQRLPSRAGEDFFFLDPFGDVYPSVVHAVTMGSMKVAESFSDLWRSTTAVAARAAVAAHAHPYWMVCTARTAIRRHALRVVAWIIRAKIGTLRRTGPIAHVEHAHRTP